MQVRDIRANAILPLGLAVLLNGCSDSGSTTATTSTATTTPTTGTTTTGTTTGITTGTVTVTPPATSTGGTSTAAVLCPYSQSTPNIILTSGVTATSTSSWTCSATTRSMTANGVPNHQIGTFPNANNPNTPTARTGVNFTATLTPVMASANSTTRLLAHALNGVVFDPATAGSCPATATRAADCTATATGTFALEALQGFFDFGVDSNNAHVQPGGLYHYHGMPEGILTAAGVTTSAQRMLLIGWAPDGFPIYARYGHVVANNATSSLTVVKGSYVVDTVADPGRPSAASVPLGVFPTDWNYVAGYGDLDDCNGRFGVTPEFPNGIYHYFATDTYPYLTRCFKGSV